MATLETKYRLMQIKSRSIADRSKGSILWYFWPSLSYHLPLRSLFCLFLSGFTQVYCTFDGLAITELLELISLWRHHRYVSKTFCLNKLNIKQATTWCYMISTTGRHLLSHYWDNISSAWKVLSFRTVQLHARTLYRVQNDSWMDDFCRTWIWSLRVTLDGF